MYYALSFILGAIVGYAITLFIWVLFTDIDRPNSHGMEGIEGLAVAYFGLFIVAPLGALIAGLVAGRLLRERKPD
jgi:hypothetical protein